jgi:hypothetical protein
MSTWQRQSEYMDSSGGDGRQNQYGGKGSDDDDIEAPLHSGGRNSTLGSSLRSTLSSDDDSDAALLSPPLRDSSRAGVYAIRMNSGSRQNSSDQLDSDDIGDARLPTSVPPTPVAKDSKRLQHDDQGKRVSRVPVRSVRKDNPTVSSPGSIGVLSRKPSLMMSKGRESKRATDGAPTQEDVRISSTTRSQLNDLEQKKLATNPPATGERRFEQRSPASRKISMTEMEREKKIAASGIKTTCDQRIEHHSVSRKLSVTELEREKKIAASGMRTTGEQHLEHRSTSRTLSVNELKQEKKIAASGMRTMASPRGSVRNSLPNALARGSIRERASTVAAKEGKVLQDQSGRQVDIDAEFARLRSGTNIDGQLGAPANIEEYDADGNLIRAAPGAIAVYCGQYEGDEDLEPDYVNPDNFDAAAHLLAQQEAATNAPDYPEEALEHPHDHSSYLQEARAESIHGDSNPGRHKLFPGRQQKKRRCLPLIVVAIMFIAVAVGVGVAVGTRGGGSGPMSTPALTTYQPSLTPTTRSPTTSPSSVAPSQTIFPSFVPSSAPSIASWLVQAEFEGENFGSSVGIVADTISFSDGNAVHSYEMRGSVWTQAGQILDGDFVRLSESRRIAVKEGSLLRMYDLTGDTWTQVGSEIEAETGTFSFQISNDGSTIAISDLITVARQRSKIWRLAGTNWLQWGEDILEVNDFGVPAGNALSLDGSRAAFSYDHASGYSLLYSEPNQSTGRWETIIAAQFVFGGGPSIAISDDAVILVTGGFNPNRFGAVNVHNTTKVGAQVALFQLPLDGYRGIALLALTNDGRRLAYAWQNNLRVIDLVDNGWQYKGVVPEIKFNIAAISFSSDGKLAVGQPDGNLIQILEIVD